MGQLVQAAQFELGFVYKGALLAQYTRKFEQKLVFAFCAEGVSVSNTRNLRGLSVGAAKILYLEFGAAAEH